MIKFITLLVILNCNAKIYKGYTFKRNPLKIIFEKTVSALAYSLVHNITGINRNNVTRFIIYQYLRMPDIYRFPIFIFTVIFGIGTVFTKGAFYYNLSPEIRRRIISNMKISRLGVFRDIIKFYESLAILKIYSHK